MAKKRKSTKGNNTLKQATASRINRPAGATSAKRTRYTEKYLTLALMGTAAFFVLKGCNDSGDVDNNNDGDGTYYSSVQDCIYAGNDSTVCADGWNNAKTLFYADVPKNLSQHGCLMQYQNCYFDSGNQAWLPVVSGFLLSRTIRKDRDEQYVYNSSGSSYSSRPVWLSTYGKYTWRSGAGNKSTASTSSFSTKKASTVSRGGYGRSSSARGHWGG